MSLLRALVLLALVLAGPGTARAGAWTDLWLTPDQQGQRLVESGEFAQAATRFTTPERIGYAWFRAGDFERAAAAFGRARGAEAAFNRGNALVMLGRYEDAIVSFETALRLRPDWREATENLELARIRLAALAPPEDDAGGTGGQLGADEIVFDSSGRAANAQAEQAVEEGSDAQTDQALRALWLRRIDTGPGRFLAIRFQYQLTKREAATDE